VAHQSGRLLAERIEKSDDVGDQVEHAVALYVGGSRGPPAASKVRGHHVVAGVGQAPKLEPPGIPQLRDPMDQEHQRPVTGLGDVDGDAVGLDLAVSDSTRSRWRL
jgi:hypothetical protein